MKPIICSYVRDAAIGLMHVTRILIAVLIMAHPRQLYTGQHTTQSSATGDDSNWRTISIRPGYLFAADSMYFTKFMNVSLYQWHFRSQNLFSFSFYLVRKYIKEIASISFSIILLIILVHFSSLLGIILVFVLVLVSTAYNYFLFHTCRAVNRKSEHTIIILSINVSIETFPKI